MLKIKKREKNFVNNAQYKIHDIITIISVID